MGFINWFPYVRPVSICRVVCVLVVMNAIGANSKSFLNGAEPVAQALQQRFAVSVHPFLKRYCFDCHGVEIQEGKLSLSGDSSLESVVKNFRTWEIVVDRLHAEEMPPSTAKMQPTTKERQAVIEWVNAVRDDEAVRHAGDPGTVLARRLSNAEYDNTVRDLTEEDIRPTREFPVDPANESGFDNSGESLTMSPALVKKYLAAARFVAEHVVLTPTGIEFALHPTVTETDRDKYCVQQIVSFYQSHAVDYADYFLAAWQYQHREAQGQPNVSLGDLALNFPKSMRGKRVTESTGMNLSMNRGDHSDASQPLSPKYLETVWSALSEPVSVGPLAELQIEWQKLPADRRQMEEVRRECERMRDRVIKLRKEFDTKVEKLHVKGNSDGSQPLVLWWNTQIAARRMTYSSNGQEEIRDAERARFCRVFPSAFSVSSRGHYADPKLGVGVRLLTAGFHLMQGYFRDDGPLCELVLDDSSNAELDRLWQNLNFVTLAPIRQYKDFLFFERAEPPQFAGGPEFDFARPENKDVISDEKLTRMSEAYVAKATEWGQRSSNRGNRNVFPPNGDRRTLD